MSQFVVVILFLSSLLCIFYLLRFLHKTWWTPIRLQAQMKLQGIRGPSYKFPHGNVQEISSMRTQFMGKPMDHISHHLFPRLQPHVYAWTKAYGRNYISWHGSQCQLFVTEPELVKEILMNREGAFPKMEMEGYAKKLLGETFITNEGKPMDHISHHLFPRLQPHVYAWTKAYGRNYISWHGSQCQLFVTEPELVKEILMNREGAFPKMEMEGYAKKLLGETLITNEGEKWAKVRKLANHTFHADSLKGMVPEMSSSVAMMLEKWEKNYVGKEFDVFKEFGMLTTEVISRTAFGSSYVDGKHIFEMMSKLTAVIVRNVYKVRVPGISFLVRSDDEVEAEKLEKAIKSCIMEKVRQRERDAKDAEFESFGCDYLGQLVKSSHECDVKKRITAEQMIDEIRTIYGAGHLTTTSLLGWCVLLLATHTEWQEKAREEVIETFGGNNPNSDGIARLKIMNMIINECLRLYPPVLTMTRKVGKETKIGELILPPKMNIYISVLALHHDPQIWGDDAHLFKPERFAQGVAKATNNNGAAFLPFGMGTRTCVGLNFTTNEAKIAVSMILQKYKIILSPNYVHYPADDFILTPKNGVQVILEKM